MLLTCQYPSNSVSDDSIYNVNFMPASDFITLAGENWQHCHFLTDRLLHVTVLLSIGQFLSQHTVQGRSDPSSSRYDADMLCFRWDYPPAQCGKDLQCSNQGFCNDGLWGANCTCTPGYAGVR